MLLPYPDRNLILTGYTGPNQPLIAKLIADRLKLRFINVDLQIEERAGTDIETVRTTYGETRLKTLESEVMQDVLLYRAALIRISGQTLMRAEYSKRLRETGPIICVVVTLDAVLRQLHLAMGGRYHDPNERALAIGKIRREWEVRKLEGIHELDATHMTQAESAAAVIDIWQKAVALTIEY